MKKGEPAASNQSEEGGKVENSLDYSMNFFPSFLDTSMQQGIFFPSGEYLVLSHSKRHIIKLTLTILMAVIRSE